MNTPSTAVSPGLGGFLAFFVLAISPGICELSKSWRAPVARILERWGSNVTTAAPRPLLDREGSVV